MKLKTLFGAAALLTLALNVQAENIKFDNPETIGKPFGYTHVVTVPANQKTVYISGQLGLDRNGKLVGADFKSQAQQAFQNLDAAIKAAGATWADVVKINMYATDLKAQMPALREVRDSFVNVKAPPASTTVQIPRLVVDGALFEIDATVVVPSK